MAFSIRSLASAKLLTRASRRASKDVSNMISCLKEFFVAVIGGLSRVSICVVESFYQT